MKQVVVMVWVGVCVFTARAQLTLLPGQVWTYEFNEVPFSHIEQVGSTPDPYFPTPRAGFVSFSYFQRPQGSDPYTAEWSVYENRVDEGLMFGSPFIAPNATHVGAENYWQDRQGVVQIKGLSGSFTLNSLHIRIHIPENAASYRVYEQTIVPEPSTIALGAVALGLWTARGWVSKQRISTAAR